MKKLTLDDVRSRLAVIKAHTDDDEDAHIMEDALHVDVLKAVWAGHPDAREMAHVALQTTKLDFSRWCA